MTLPNGQMRQLVRAGAAIGHLTDMVDHYSQLANYMRLNNILPPASCLPARFRISDRLTLHSAP